MITNTISKGGSTKQYSFWQLVNEHIIQIPNYQREYAQGRLNRRAELIREGFVKAIFDSLNSNEPLELDFIFGGSEGDKNLFAFNPVDGQQRLTMLFLIHWYLFKRCEYYDDLKILQERFLYMTRSTSEHFCGELCDQNVHIDFSKKPACGNKRYDDGRIASQIANQSWFTGAMSNDPTIESMLVVIDVIHNQFFKYGIERCKECAELLKSNECPITFFCLNLSEVLGGSSGILDLYIKMNARGLSLTDFELFKTDLQKKKNTNDKLDVLGEYLGEKDTLANRVHAIGKFNNEYTNFFFQLIDGGKIVDLLEQIEGQDNKKQLFDLAMMNFINEVFRMDYFCVISQLGVSQKTYRSYNDPFKKMSGKELSSFIETSGQPYNTIFYKDKKGTVTISNDDIDLIKNTIQTSFENIISLLDVFSKNQLSDEPVGSKCCFQIKELIKLLGETPQNSRVLTTKESVSRMGLYLFILKYGLPDNKDSKECYTYWNRFVWKICNNTEFDHFDEAIETLRGFRIIIDNCSTCNKKDLINTIAAISVDDMVFGASSLMQLEEEHIKAKCISSDSDWACLFEDAENYYCDNGQIWFLLELAKRGDDYIKSDFSHAFNISKMVFDSHAHIVNADSKLFERALIASVRSTDKDHLKYMGKYTKSTKLFVGKDFSKYISHQYEYSNDEKENDKYNITMGLLKEIINSCKNQSINDWLNNYLKGKDSSTEWKSVFIKYDILNAEIPGFCFKNGFEPDSWIEDEYGYTAVFTSSKKRIDYCGELCSLALAKTLCEDGYSDSVEYHRSSDDYYMNNDFPNRYFSIADCKVGYIKGEYYTKTASGIKKIGAFDDAKMYLENMLNCVLPS